MIETDWWVYPASFIAAYLVAAVATPVGVSGAVLLLPIQVGVLGTPSPAVTPTNLLYNVVATPGALFRYRRQNQTGGRLTRALVLGTIPGVVAGSVIRVELVPDDAGTFRLIVAAVLIPLGISLLFRNGRPRAHGWTRFVVGPWLVALAACVGVVGGIYGIGGGSILAPILVGSGRPPSEVAPATLMATFLTSIAAVITFVVLATGKDGSIAPVWGVGITLGLGGLLGGYTGARLQPRLPESAIRRLLGIIVLVIGVRYVQLGI